jgi:sugar (pentulose or hexulose) kinase
MPETKPPLPLNRMSIALGLDVGTTTITALALELGSGEVAARATVANDAETTAPRDKQRGRSEWDAARIAGRAAECLAEVARQLGGRAREYLGLAVTGQQHGVVLCDGRRRPLTPLIGWQDGRCAERIEGGQSCLDIARQRLGADAPRRAGCRLATGYMGATLFWMNQQGAMPPDATACFLPDWCSAALCETAPVTDPTLAASSGVFAAAERRWDLAAAGALDLDRSLFPEVREAGEPLGRLSAVAARDTGLPAGLRVFVPLGDNQASFLGSVSDLERGLLVNVGTGGQVSAWTEPFTYASELETRPFPREGHLLVSAGLCGGRAYAVLAAFLADVGRLLLGVSREARELFEAMDRLAESAPAGAGGVRCRPLFTGTRAKPELRAAWTDISRENFTAANFVRALLEGMAVVFAEGRRQIEEAAGGRRGVLFGAGNGLRENRLLARLVAEEFGLAMRLPRHREEAAVGAALVAAVGAGAYPDLASAAKALVAMEKTN